MTKSKNVKIARLQAELTRVEAENEQLVAERLQCRDEAALDRVKAAAAFNDGVEAAIPPWEEFRLKHQYFANEDVALVDNKDQSTIYSTTYKKLREILREHIFLTRPTTQEKPNDDTEIEALCKRLGKSHEFSGNYDDGFRGMDELNNPDGPEAVAAIRQLQEQLKKAHERDLEAIRLFIENLYDDAPSHPYDNGATRDGWQMACNKIQGYVEGVQKARAARSENEVEVK